jgi:ribosomal protein S21
MDMVKTLLESESVEVALEKFKKESLLVERGLPLNGSG